MEQQQISAKKLKAMEKVKRANAKLAKVAKVITIKIIKREELLANMIAPGEVVHSTLITTYEPERNEYSGVFSKVITFDDLFA